MGSGFNTKMVIAKGKAITQKIKFMKKDEGRNLWVIIFNNETTYTYNPCNVSILDDPVSLEPSLYKVFYQGKEECHVDTLLRFKDGDDIYYRVIFKSGYVIECHSSKIDIRESALMDDKKKNCFDYLKEISSISKIKDENGEKLLQKYYCSISYLDPRTVLAGYLTPEDLRFTQNDKVIPIFPFGCNRSQMKAVRNALSNRISAIEGPPGTGKTQTILNIIANLVLQGKSIVVVSNNNSATDNVFEKLDKYGLSFIAATLGSSSNKKSFIGAQTGLYPDWSEFEAAKTSSIHELRALQESLNQAYEQEEAKAELRDMISQLEVEHNHFKELLDPNVKFPEERKILDSEFMVWLMKKMKERADKKPVLSWFFRFSLVLFEGLGSMDYWKQSIDTLLPVVEELWYQKKLAEMHSKIAELEAKLKVSNSTSKSKELVEKSMGNFKHALYQKYGKDSRRILTDNDLWKTPDEFLKEYPVILSTTFSARKSLSKDTCFDYLIMDEASQIDIATGALALSSAKNAIIVGDRKQLPNIVSDLDRLKAESIFKKYDLNQFYDYSSNSFLDSILGLFPDCPYTLLREHYRCHPKIIGFCNKKFYGGKLLAMTEDHGEDAVLTAIKTVPGMHSREHVNQREIDAIVKEVLPKISCSMNDVGIISPYNAQVIALTRAVPECDVSTVHKFQGREKNVIVLSTTDSEITEFSDDSNLVNVAVSRAVDRFVLVTNGNPMPTGSCIGDLLDYIEYNSFTATESKLRSVFDLLYDAYREDREKYLKDVKRISEFDSENLMYKLINDILAEDDFNAIGVVCHHPLRTLIRDTSLMDAGEKRYASHPNTHLDFLLFSKISKRPLLAIEVDGYNYHKEDSRQGERDAMKNSILDKYGIPWLRFKTNGSGERECIVAKLKEILSKCLNGIFRVCGVHFQVYRGGIPLGRSDDVSRMTEIPLCIHHYFKKDFVLRHSFEFTFFSFKILDELFGFLDQFCMTSFAEMCFSVALFLI